MSTRDSAGPTASRPRSARPEPGDADPLVIFGRLKAYTGWTEADSRYLQSLFPLVEPRLDTIVEDFYARILQDPGARRALSEGEEQIRRLKQSLRQWLVHVLKGPHDEGLALLQARVGRAHVKVGLDQIYMVTGMQVFRQHICRLICADGSREARDCLSVLEAVDKILTIVLALMLETYREDFLRRLLESEKNATTRRLAALGEVAASLAHEIRNPLAGISGAIQVLGQDLDSSDSRHEILREILREIGRLDERVNDLLMYSKPSTPSLEPTRPADILETTRRILLEDPATDGVGLHFHAPEGLEEFPLDRGQIQQVLVNLVLNALQVLGGEGEVWIEAERQGGGSLRLSVEDSGPGIRPEDLEKIFQPFYTTRRHGTGLGLSISRRLIEAHGGTLEAGRGARGGARFVIHLPPPSREDRP